VGKTGAVFPANRGNGEAAAAAARYRSGAVLVFVPVPTSNARTAIEPPKFANALPASLAAGLIAACGIALAVLAGYTESYGRLASWSDDLEQRMTARPISFRRAVVFDIDAESMRRLEHQVGEWPYTRDIFSLVTNWLWRAGAQAVVFDIPFYEARTGDRAFAAALNSRTVLAAVPLANPMEREPAFIERLRAQGLQVAGIDPRLLHSTDLALPRAEFTPPGRARVGVGGVATPFAGIGGRLALLHESHGEVLPDLPLAALLAASSWPQVSVAGGKLAAGDWRWPVTDAGEVFLRYPSNAGDLPVLPFYRLALAAAGVPEHASLAREVRGRTVLIGRSRALPADGVHAPPGPRSGLHHAALATEMLAQGQVSRPGSALVDALLFALALALPLCALARGARARGRDHLAGAAGALVLPVVAGIGLFAAGQVSHWPLAVLAGLLVQVLGAAWWRFGMRLRPRVLGAQDTLGTGRLGIEFLRRLVDELRTPLGGIMTFNRVNQAAEDPSKEERIRVAAIIARNCDQMLTVLNNHLDFANARAGQLVLEPRPENPIRHLEQALDALRPAAGEKGLALAMEVARTPPGALVLDAVRLRQVLLGLLANAVRFTDAGSVKLGVDWDGEALVVEVRDTGRGIAPDAIERIAATLQWRGDAACSDGDGLGLVGALVHAMGGTAAVSSHTGEGTRISVRIPCAVAARAPAAEAHGGAGADGAPIAIRIDPAARHLLPRFIELCHNDVAGMRSALDAGDFDSLRKTGHKLKGAGGSYGFDDITRIGAAVEGAAKSADGTRSRELIEELARYLERVRPLLD